MSTSSRSGAFWPRPRPGASGLTLNVYSRTATAHGVPSPRSGFRSERSVGRRLIGCPRARPPKRCALVAVTVVSAVWRHAHGRHRVLIDLAHFGEHLIVRPEHLFALFRRKERGALLDHHARLGALR